MKLTTGFK